MDIYNKQESMMKEIPGGVCAPKGFKAAGIHCGLSRNPDKNDLALIYSEKRAAAAAVYTTNLVKGAPLLVTKENISDGRARAVICNSVNANTCNADGQEKARGMCALAAGVLGCDASDIVVASTGVIGQRLDIAPIERGIDALASSLSQEGSESACHAIMTTDTVKKEFAVEFEISGRKCRIGAIAKGSGMIHPNMATMLCFITSDVNISPQMLDSILKADIPDTFNMVTVDGDTSTNDMVVILSNGMARNDEINAPGEAADAFARALHNVMVHISRAIAKDGEGASKLLECVAFGAKTKEAAKTVSKAIVSSSLFKAAMFGADANWGRALCAIGYSGADVDITKVGLAFKNEKGEVKVCENGAGVDFSEEEAKEILLGDEIQILVSLNDGKESATAWGCDLTYDYVKINGSYRS